MTSQPLSSIDEAVAPSNSLQRSHSDAHRLSVSHSKSDRDLPTVNDLTQQLQHRLDEMGRPPARESSDRLCDCNSASSTRQCPNIKDRRLVSRFSLMCAITLVSLCTCIAVSALAYNRMHRHSHQTQVDSNIQSKYADDMQQRRTLQSQVQDTHWNELPLSIEPNAEFREALVVFRSEDESVDIDAVQWMQQTSRLAFDRPDDNRVDEDIEADFIQQTVDEPADDSDTARLNTLEFTSDDIDLGRGDKLRRKSMLARVPSSPRVSLDERALHRSHSAAAHSAATHAMLPLSVRTVLHPRPQQQQQQQQWHTQSPLAFAHRMMDDVSKRLQTVKDAESAEASDADAEAADTDTEGLTLRQRFAAPAPGATPTPPPTPKTSRLDVNEMRSDSAIRLNNVYVGPASQRALQIRGTYSLPHFDTHSIRASVNVWYDCQAIDVDNQQQVIQQMHEACTHGQCLKFDVPSTHAQKRRISVDALAAFPLVSESDWSSMQRGARCLSRAALLLHSSHSETLLAHHSAFIQFNNDDQEVHECNQQDEEAMQELYPEGSTSSHSSRSSRRESIRRQSGGESSLEDVPLESPRRSDLHNSQHSVSSIRSRSPSLRDSQHSRSHNVESSIQHAVDTPLASGHWCDYDLIEDHIPPPDAPTESAFASSDAQYVQQKNKSSVWRALERGTKALSKSARHAVRDTLQSAHSQLAPAASALVRQSSRAPSIDPHTFALDQPRHGIAHSAVAAGAAVSKGARKGAKALIKTSSRHARTHTLNGHEPSTHGSAHHTDAAHLHGHRNRHRSVERDQLQPDTRSYVEWVAEGASSIAKSAQSAIKDMQEHQAKVAKDRRDTRLARKRAEQLKEESIGFYGPAMQNAVHSQHPHSTNTPTVHDRHTHRHSEHTAAATSLASARDEPEWHLSAPTSQSGRASQSAAHTSPLATAVAKAVSASVPVFNSDIVDSRYSAMTPSRLSKYGIVDTQPADSLTTQR